VDNTVFEVDNTVDDARAEHRALGITPEAGIVRGEVARGHDDRRVCRSP
jgi:hypothetical protein